MGQKNISSGADQDAGSPAASLSEVIDVTCDVMTKAGARIDHLIERVNALHAERDRLRRSLDIWRDLAERADHLAICVFKAETKGDRKINRHNAAVLTNAISHARQNEANAAALSKAGG